MFLYDYHMHSNHSTDGSDNIYQLCSAAVRIGLREIAVTDHFEPTSWNQDYPEYSYEKYALDIEKARKIFNKKIKIKSAIELGQPHLYPEHTNNLLAAKEYDYVIASAHKMADDTDFGDLIYTSENVSSYCLKYLDELEALIKWNKFDCLAHFDLLKRYAANFNLKAGLVNYRERLETVLKMLVENGKGMEVNTSGLRQSAKECLPNLDILKIYRELGGEIVTIGSDAHNAQDVGKGVMEAVELIKDAGFRYISVFNNRKPSMISISSTPALFNLSKNSA